MIDHNYKFSVLMSVYKKENEEYLAECIESLLQQTMNPDEIVIVKDGSLTEELEGVLENYSRKYPQLFNIVGYEKNHGLGYALAYGLERCKHELVARMDTDDIARKDRFEIQIREFKKDKELAVCGSHIIEFSKNVNIEKARRKVPLMDEDIKSKGKYRDPFNHMTVMFRRSKILEVGNYESCLLMEDSVLWAKLLIYPGVKAMNIDDYLVYVRAGDDMIGRRGGIEYLKRYINGRKRMREIGYINEKHYYLSIIAQMIVSLIPIKIRNIVFVKLLRN